MNAVQVKDEISVNTVVNHGIAKQNSNRSKKVSSLVVQRGTKHAGRATNSVQNTSNPHDRVEDFFTEKAVTDMASGKIPNFIQLYHSLKDIQAIPGFQLSAINFLQALREFSLTDTDEIERFINNPETNHVLVQNDKLKMVFIRWEPGSSCKIHGHAAGGCVFKVLQGKVLEKRFSADEKQQLLSENTYYQDSIAYIDDIVGLHSVENPNNAPAITLHLYTPGNYKGKNCKKTQ